MKMNDPAYSAAPMRANPTFDVGNRMRVVGIPAREVRARH
jgi:hypothetical protein